MLALGAQNARKRLAILPWGDLIEDYLDAIGISLEQMCREMTGGWLFGYVEALQRAGVECVLFVITARVDQARSFRHEPTGMLVRALPCQLVYRGLRRFISKPYGRSGAEMFGISSRWQRVPAGLLRPLVPYFNTPLAPLARELRRHECNAILCQEYEFSRFDLVILLGARLGLPVFASFQGGDRPFSGLERSIRRRSLGRARGLIIGASREAERVRATYGVPAERIASIPNPLDLDFWSPEDRAAARAALGLPADGRIVVWHGRVDMRRKGLDLLLDAWQRLPSDRQGVKRTLLLIGTGADAALLGKRLGDLADESIIWIDRFVNDRPLMRRYLSAADLYVLPSRHEGFAVAPLEAMACGLPIVAADVAGIADVLPRGEESGGLVVPREDARALAKALDRLIGSPGEGADLGVRARREIEGRFSFATVGQALECFMFGGHQDRA
jgi:starch synthase